MSMWEWLCMRKPRRPTLDDRDPELKDTKERTERLERELDKQLRILEMEKAVQTHGRHSTS